MKSVGWWMSRTAWRFFLIDLAIDIPVILASLLLLVLALTPVVCGLQSSRPDRLIVGSLLNSGLFVAGIMLAIVAGTLLSVLKRFFRQVCAPESLGVIASIRHAGLSSGAGRLTYWLCGSSCWA